MRRPWEQGGRWWRALSVVMLLLAACAVPPAGPEPATSRQAAPSAGPSAGSVGSVGAAEADAASILLLRQAVAQQQAQIKPDGASAGGSFRAVQPAPGLQLRFGPSGVEATPAEIKRTALREARPEPAPAWRWRMALAGLGYAAEPPPVGEADLVLAGERLEYRRGSVVEWYRNEPGRLEQGFTLPERPAGGPIGQPLRLTLTIDSDLTAHVDAAEQAVTWVDANGLVGLKYHGLRVVDAQGREVPNRLALWRGGVALELLDGEAEYPLTIDPWLEQQKVTASDGAPGDTFGFSVAISGDTAIIGANEDTIGGNADQGSAYVFTPSGSTWTQQQKLTASDGAAGDFFGNSVAISVDTVIVGANLDTVGANATQGSAYVFTRSGSTWTEQQKLTASDGAAFDLFGSSVAIDGDTAIVGAFADTVGANGSQSSAYVFAFVTSTPTATATSTATSTPTSTQTQTATPTATATATSASTSRHCWALLPASSPRAG